MPVQIKLKEQINPHFYKLWRTQKPYIIAKGGRGSFKSSVISMRLVLNMLQQVQYGRKVNIVCIRENAVNLRDSVFEQILWAINQLGVASKFKPSNSLVRITHVATGSAFYFYGADDPLKLKSNTVPDIIDLWFEEAANVKGPKVFDQTIPTFIRNKSPYVDQVQVFYSYNPPRNPYDWVNEWVTRKENDPDYLVDMSTYLDDELGFTTQQQIKLIQTYKDNDPDYYRWLYLGEVIGLGTNVYNMDLFNPLEEIPDDDHVGSLYFSADTGHAASATAVGAYGLLSKRDKNGKPRLVLLDTYYYSPQGKAHKKSPSELSKDIWKFIQRIEQQYEIKAWKYIMDSAEAALRNQMKNDYGLTWTPVKKLKKSHMIEYVQSLLAQGRFYYLPTENNVGIFVPQHEQYQWDEKTVESDDPHVIKEFDHTNDEFQYLIISILRELDLKY